MLYSYKDVDNYIISLPVPLDSIQNASEVAAFEQRKKEVEAQGGRLTDPKEVVRPRVSLNSCMNRYKAAEMVEGFYSTAVKKNVTVSK